MPKAMVDDWKQFEAFLASQPFCQWAWQKEQEMALREKSGNSGKPASSKKDDNADLLAALSAMA